MTPARKKQLWRRGRIPGEKVAVHDAFKKTYRYIRRRGKSSTRMGQ
jgi:hypothetical protein